MPRSKGVPRNVSTFTLDSMGRLQGRERVREMSETAAARGRHVPPL